MVFVHNFKGYKIEYSKSATKDLSHIDHENAKKVKDKFEKLVSGDHNIDVKRLQEANKKRYRLRFGNYRAIFEVNEHIITIIVISVDHRKDAYD